MFYSCNQCPFASLYTSEEQYNKMRQYPEHHYEPQYTPYYPPQYTPQYAPYYPPQYVQPQYPQFPPVAQSLTPSLTPSGAPSGPPPSYIPSQTYSTPGTQVPPCTNRYIYIWLNNGAQFWALITNIGTTNAYGYRWHSSTSTWTPYRVALSRITSFLCD